MAHSRRRNVRGRARRRSAWVEMANELVGTLTGANVPRELILLLPTTDAEQVTLVRIVGAVHMGLQTSTAADQVTPLAWGIYIAGSGTGSDLVMDPLESLDMQSEHWMHMRTVWANTDNAGTNTGINGLLQRVDVRVKRVVAEGDGIKWSAKSPSAWVSAVRLRGLVLLP